MTDLEYVAILFLAIFLFAILIAILEWIDPVPKDWVVVVRRWLARWKK